MKICTKCKETKPYESFYKQKVNSKDGFQSHCKACDNKRKKEWTIKNPDKAKVHSKISEQNRMHNEERRKYRKDLKKQPNMRASLNNSYAKRRAAKLYRTPKWTSEDDKKEIKAFYVAAQILTILLDEKWHVDHDIPLQGNLVSGLHVPANLRLLRGIDNETKGNKYTIS